MPKMTKYEQQLADSKTPERRAQDKKILKEYFHALNVRETDEKTDKAGADYLVTTGKKAVPIPHGAGGVFKLAADAKRRAEETRPFWQTELPDIAFPFFREKGACWTKNPKYMAQYILFLFEGTPLYAYILPVHELQLAFAKYEKEWIRKYKTHTTATKRGVEKVVFVPITIVLAAITEFSDFSEQARNLCNITPTKI